MKPLSKFIVVIWIATVSPQTTGSHERSYPLSGEWLYQAAHRLEQREDLHGEIACDRRLDRDDQRLLLETSDFLLDVRNRNGARLQAARVLGYLGHRQGIGALAAVLRDETDESGVRATCATALGGINDFRVVDILISQLNDGDMNVWHYSQWTLKGIRGFQNDPRPRIPPYPATQEGRQAYQKLWRIWWNEHRKVVPQVSLRLSYLEQRNNGGLPPRSPQDGE